ncbi:MAG TPA: nicotinamide riboside transporter PnuC [Allosphingosinicella sp.]|nr:nicotinamide riboside transporter PnuC [Allosphingosinicella sp.]
MNTLEWVAAGLGVINVGLLVRRSIWNYPFGLAMVSLYFFIFYETRLYSDAWLQVFFFAVQLYGWWSWARAKQDAGEVRVGLLSGRERALCVALTVGVSLALGYVMATYTPASAPYIDASIAGMSISAQILLAWRKLENWVLWIVTDIVAIGLYLSKALYPTAILYGLLLVLCLVGFADWRRKLIAQGAPAQ